jgi:hypothetical protein
MDRGDVPASADADVVAPPLERFSQAIATLLLYLRDEGGQGGGDGGGDGGVNKVDTNNVSFLEGIAATTANDRPGGGGLHGHDHGWSGAGHSRERPRSTVTH